MTLGQAIRKVRRDQDLTQKELAAAAVISHTYLSEIENGIKTPRIEHLQNICIALDVPMVVLLFMTVPDEEKLSVSQKIFNHTFFKA